MKLNKSEVAKIYGLTRNAISDWTIVGCPYTPGRPGQEAQFDLERVIAWRRERLRRCYSIDRAFISEEVRRARRRAQAILKRRSKR
ncbi:hypothetical protein [Nitrospira sp. Nam80]